MFIILLFQFIQWWLGGLAAIEGQSQNTQTTQSSLILSYANV